MVFSQMGGVNDEQNQILIVDESIHKNDHAVYSETDIESCAQLQIDSNDKGLLIPRVADHTALDNFSDGDDKKGMLIYDTTDNTFYLYTGSWTALN